MKSEKIKEEKLRKIEQELHEKRAIILSLQEQNKAEVLDVYEKTQLYANQSKKQLESYYKTLLKNHEEKLTFEEKKSIEKAKEH